MKKIALTIVAVCAAGITFASVSTPSDSVINKEEHKCHSAGQRCSFCNGSGFQGNYNCPICKGTGRVNSY